MSTTLTYIPDDIAQKINDTADLVEIAEKQNLQLKKKRNTYEADCPFCQAKKKFNIFRDKRDGKNSSRFNAYKCFVCDTGGAGAAKLLMQLPGVKMSYPEALHYLAEHYNIDIEASVEKRVKNYAKGPSFRDRQLLESGISEADQKWQEQRGEAKWVEQDRYQAATLSQDNRIVPGDDMVLHYLDLEGKPVLFKNKGGKMTPLVRVRWQHPHNHLSKDGKPMKYMSLYGSPSALWLPNAILRAYKQAQSIDTLYIEEGEKKADKSCQHGMWAVGLQGIHNLKFGEMTSIFERIITRCNVQRVVFVMDSDWHDIGSGENADWRPKGFFSAAKKFKNYFYGYKNSVRPDGSPIELDIRLAFVKSKVEKGIDDLLTRSLKGKENELKEDFEKAFIDPQGEGEHVRVVNVTTMSQQKMLELWDLQNPQAFIKAHEAELKQRKEFKVKGYAWTWEDGEAVMMDRMHEDEQFWTEETLTDRYGQPKTDDKGNEKKKLTFNYYACWRFLRNRGYYLYKIPENQEGLKYRLIRVQNKVVDEVVPHDVQQFVKDYVENMGRIDVLNMLFRGGSQYLGPEKLSNLWYLKPEFVQPERECTYLIFRNVYWKITAENIEQRPLAELSANVWSSKIIDFDPKLHQGGKYLDVERQGEHWKITESDEVKKCEMYQFYLATSNFHWRKKYELATDEEGVKCYVEKENPEKYTLDEIRELTAHATCKMLATGYTLQGFRNKAQMKAIVAMDGIESAVGKSEGGTGKSIVATQFGMRSGKLTPTFVIDGKKNIETDPFPFDGLDERHGVMVFDDVRVNFKFEWLFAKITTMIEANWKNRTKLFLDPMPIWIATNHALNGHGNSFRRRQYHIAFSDFFNGNRTPHDVFGHQLFDDWDWAEWNRYYNFIACCIQTFLKFPDLNRYTIPNDDLEKRKLRQLIGEDFLEFAELYFSSYEEDEASQLFGPDSLEASNRKGCYRNVAVNKKKIYQDFISEFPSQSKYSSVKKIKEKVNLYCDYAELDFTPNAGSDGRLKHNGQEYLIVADEKFDAENYEKVN